MIGIKSPISKLCYPGPPLPSALHLLIYLIKQPHNLPTHPGTPCLPFPGSFHIYYCCNNSWKDGELYIISSLSIHLARASISWNLFMAGVLLKQLHTSPLDPQSSFINQDCSLCISPQDTGFRGIKDLIRDHPVHYQ